MLSVSNNERLALACLCSLGITFHRVVSQSFES